MSDIVERLRRSWSTKVVESDNPYLSELVIHDGPTDICLEAAEEIERLHSMIKRAMEHGVNGSDYYDAAKAGDLGKEMRELLNQSSKERDDD